jgi:hypothetical protein
MDGPDAQRQCFHGLTKQHRAEKERESERERATTQPTERSKRGRRLPHTPAPLPAPHFLSPPDCCLLLSSGSPLPLAHIASPSGAQSSPQLITILSFCDLRCAEFERVGWLVGEMAMASTRVAGVGVVPSSASEVVAASWNGVRGGGVQLA